MAATVGAQVPPDSQMPPPPPMSTSKQTRILIWRNEVASALDDAASSASSRSSSSTVTTNTTATAASASGLAPASPTSSFSSASSRPRALWKRLSRRLAIHHSSDAAATPAESSRTAMYRDNPPEAALALEGLTVVDGGLDRPDGDAQAQPSGRPVAEPQEEQLLAEESSSDGGGRGLRERQERLQRAARLLQHGPRKEDRPPPVSVNT